MSHGKLILNDALKWTSILHVQSQAQAHSSGRTNHQFAYFILSRIIDTRNFEPNSGKASAEFFKKTKIVHDPVPFRISIQIEHPAAYSNAHSNQKKRNDEILACAAMSRKRNSQRFSFLGPIAMLNLTLRVRKSRNEQIWIDAYSDCARLQRVASRKKKSMKQFTNIETLDFNLFCIWIFSPLL